MIEKADLNKSEIYTLSIRLSTDGFSFSVFDPTETNSTLLYQKADLDANLPLTANLDNIFRETEWLARPFRRVNVLVCGKRFTTVPQAYFTPEEAGTFFYHNHSKLEHEDILYDIRRRYKLVLVFGIDTFAHRFLKKQYPAAHFYHQASPLLECFAAKSRLGNTCKLYAHLRKNAVDTFAFQHGQLLIANSYACSEMIDRLYYLLYLWKTLNFDQENDELHLCGLLEGKEQLISELRKFIRNVYIMNPVENIDLQYITTCE